MSAFSNYYANIVVNATVRGTSFTPPSTVYLGLFKASTGLNEDNLGTAQEVTGGSYARQAVTFVAPTNGATQLTANVTFPMATANWGTVTHIAIMDASTAGHVIYWAAVTASKAIDIDDTLVVNAADCTLTVT